MKHSKKNCVASPDDKLMIRLILDRISPYTGMFYAVFGSTFFIIEKSHHFYYMLFKTKKT